MYALTVTSKKQLERATSRAQVQKPKIEEVEFGIYNVWSTDPKKPNTFYIVGIQPARDGGYEVACGCPTQNYFCKHVAAVMPHYLMREKEQEAADLAASVQLPPVEEARAQAAEALAALSLVVGGVITTSEQEIDRLIEQANEESLDRECPACGLVQPDDDSTDCVACGAILDPEDEDPEPDPDPAVCGCGKPGFSYFNGEWHCWECTQQLAEAEAEKDAVRKLEADFDKDFDDIFGFAPIRSTRVKEAW